MSRQAWEYRYINPAVGYLAQGTCAACDYSGPPADFTVWSKTFRVRVLCNQCTTGCRTSMLYEGWTRANPDRDGMI